MRIAAILLAVVAVALLGAAAAPARVAGGDEPRCFGAASRDAAKPCHNPRLRRMVRPTPAQARKGLNAPCKPVERVGQVGVCEFGTPAEEATATVALLGDSHAAHWRAAMIPVAQAQGWRGLAMIQTGCPLSKARKVLPPQWYDQCVRWNDEIGGYLGAHPEIQTVFVSEIVSRFGVEVPPGGEMFPTEVKGYQDAWQALPASVKQIVVIRDDPKARKGILSCVEHAMARGLRAGVACAIPRRVGLERDPAVVAARRLDSPRVRVIDLSDVFCSRRRCFPVIGGALVYKDRHHLTRVFATTVAPILLRRVRALLG
jgi:hypothetical protein